MTLPGSSDTGDLLTIQLTVHQARAVHSAASIFSQAVSEINPEWELHLDHGDPPALTTGLLALEAELMLA